MIVLTISMKTTRVTETICCSKNEQMKSLIAWIKAANGCKTSSKTASAFPCNESYVSFACSNSPDGIVYSYKNPSEWLGALLPANATETPPVSGSWLFTVSRLLQLR